MMVLRVSDITTCARVGRAAALIMMGLLLWSVPERVSGQILVANYDGGTIAEYSTFGTLVNPALISGLNQPVRIAVFGDDVYVVNSGSGTVGKYTTAGATVDAALITGLNRPFAIAVSEDGAHLFVANNNDLTEGSGTIGKYTTSGTLVNAAFIVGLTEVGGIAVSGGTLFITSTSGTSINRGIVGTYDAVSGAAINPQLLVGLQVPGSISVVGENFFVAIGPFLLPGSLAEYTTSGQFVGTVVGNFVEGISDFALSGTDVFIAYRANLDNIISEYTTLGAPVNASLISGLTGLAGIAVISPSTTINKLLNISTRLRVLSDPHELIGGFIVTGTTPKKVILRAIGPSLSNANPPVPGALADPILELHENAGGVDTIIASNDNWIDSPDKQAIIDSTVAPTDDRESAIIATLQPFTSISPITYTAVLRGNNNTSGVALAEGYELDQSVESTIANISTRGFVDTGDNVMIGGIIVGATGNILVRAIGPSLLGAGIESPLPDPMLELHAPNGELIASNDNWKDNQQSAIDGTGIPPSDDAESAILSTLPPGNYTAIMSGKNNGTGIGLVEVYSVP